MPRVSIITALYNHEKYVEQAIQSVLSQTYSDWELILWDDGSTDRSVDIARRYAVQFPDRVLVFSHPKGANMGQESTRNAALAKARGELIGLLDSDDLYHPRKLELLVPCFENPKVGLAYGIHEILLEATGKRIPSGIKRHPAGKVLDTLLFENFLGAGATLFRRTCLSDDIKFDSAFRAIGEYPLWIRIARDWELAYVPQSVSVWRDHGKNVGTELAVQSKFELVQLFERMLNDPEYMDFRQAVRASLSKKRYDYASALYGNMDLKQARAEFRKLLNDPFAPGEIRAKSALLAAMTALGRPPNQAFALAKRAMWEMRFPSARAARRAREK